jgi:hypothetical protein
MAQSHLEEARQLYERHALNFESTLAWHLCHGYVVSTPFSFGMARRVNRATFESDAYPVGGMLDAWFLEVFVGKCDIFLPFMPYVGWRRFSNNRGIRWYPYDEVAKRFFRAQAQVG